MKSSFKIYSCKRLGVFSSKVIPPSAHICNKGEKVFDRLFYVVSGSIVFNNTIFTKAGDIVYLPNNITYKSYWKEDMQGQYISINFINSNKMITLPEKICVITHDTTGLYYNLFMNCLKIYNNNEIGYQLNFFSQLYNILYCIYKDVTKYNLKDKHKIIYKGIIYIENNYLEDIDIKMVAQYCNVSECTFRRLFKKYKKIPPVTYKNYLRIKKAEELLLTSEYTVSEIAELVNIPDICYFNKLFRKFTSMSPMEYYKKNIKE